MEDPRVMREMVDMLREKVQSKPLIIGLTKRRGKERKRREEQRQRLNKKLLEKQEDWSCDDLQL